MEKLVIGQNKPLGSSAQNITVSYPSELGVIAFSVNGNKKLSNTLNLAELTAQGVTKVELAVKTAGTLSVQVDNQPFAEVNTEISAAIAIIGRLYLHNSEWRFRALNEVFNSLNAAQAYFGINQIFPVKTQETIQQTAMQVRDNVQNAFSQVRTKLQENGVEQAVLTGATQAVQSAKKLANGLQQTFTQVMGNSDAVARQQAENDFKPMDMVKMQSVQFSKEITNLHLGLGWKSKTGTGLLKGLLGGNKSVNVDLDLSAQILSNTGEVLDTVFFDKIRSDTYAVVHYGDAAQGGNGLQDNEVISIAFNNLPQNAAFIAVTATSQKGHQFNGIESGYLRVVNQSGMIPLVQINLDPNETKTGVLLGILVLNSANSWEFVAISDYFQAKNVNELAPNILHWAKLIGQSRGIVPTNSALLIGG